MKKRICSILTALALCLTLLPATAWAEGSEGTGDTETTTGSWADSAETDWYTGHENDPSYTISTAAQLAGLAVLVNDGVNGSRVTFQGKTITLGDSIDLSGKEWTPIGKYPSYVPTKYAFQGTFDGSNKTVSGLCVNINTTNDTSSGLFGYVKGGTVKNLNVSGTVTVENNSPAVYVGGVVGQAENTTVENCSFSGGVTGIAKNTYSSVGGVVGYANGSTTVKNCSNSGAVTAESQDASYAGGVVGQASATSSSGNRVTVENCRSTGAVSNTSTGGSVHTGGVVGYTYYADVSNCYNTGDVGSTYTGTGSNNTGGVVGGANSNSTVKNCYNTGAVTVTGTAQKQYTGGAVGYTFYTAVGNCYFLQDEDSSLNAIGSGSGTNVEGKNSAAFAGGEVACLLQSGQTSEDGTEVWVQVKGTDGTYYPALYVLLSEEERAQICAVYVVTFTAGDTTIEGFPVVKYAVAGGTVAEIPTAPEGYAWCTGNEEFTASTVVTGNLTVTAKPRATAPTTAPELDSRTTSSIKLKEVAANANSAAAQYGISTDNGTTWTWQDSPAFTGLTSGTEYTFSVRYGGTDDYAPSLPSPTVKISTDEQPSVVEPVDPVVPVVPPVVVTPTYPPIIEDTEHGTVSVTPANPRQGSTVTVTPSPDKGYETASVTVTDSRGNPVKVTDNGDGTYSFTQPAGRVTVSVSFSKIVKELPFTDVSADDYFFDAVVWAVENGVTYGNTATTFGVGVTCNRADAVTFIWRAYGCPAPKNRENPFTDVADSAYYADAVLWAVENGITVGTSATTFSPLESCRREHIVTFLYRAAGSPTVSHSSGFVDVADSAYYANAVTWAAENGITVGAGSATTFGPTQNCFREQIVTFLYRNLAE